MLAELDLHGVVVVGNSIGGWTAAEMALLADARVAGVVLVDAVGLTSDTEPIVDFFSLTLDQVADLSYADPDRFRLDADALPDAARRAMAGNRAALLAYGGTSMADPTLLGRLPAVPVPALVVWGAADRVVAPSHGSAYAAAIPGRDWRSSRRPATCRSWRPPTAWRRWCGPSPAPAGPRAAARSSPGRRRRGSGCAAARRSPW